MKIDTTVVAAVADLAKLRVDESGYGPMADRMSRILDLVEEMQALDTEGVEPLANPLDAVQRLRPDEITETGNRDKYQALAPDSENGLYLVPRVVE